MLNFYAFPPWNSLRLCRAYFSVPETAKTGFVAIKSQNACTTREKQPGDSAGLKTNYHSHRIFTHCTSYILLLHTLILATPVPKRKLRAHQWTKQYSLASQPLFFFFFFFGKGCREKKSVWRLWPGFRGLVPECWHSQSDHFSQLTDHNVCRFICEPKWGSLNSLDLRNGGVALYLENSVQQARTAKVCTLALLLNDLEIDSSLLPSPIPSLK